jgi:hypothetical protein
MRAINKLGCSQRLDGRELAKTSSKPKVKDRPGPFSMVRFKRNSRFQDLGIINKRDFFHCL